MGDVRLDRHILLEELDAVRLTGDMYVDYLIEEIKYKYEEYMEEKENG